MSSWPSARRADAPHWRRVLSAVCIAQATAVVGFDFTLPFIPLYLQHDLGVHGLGQIGLWSGLIGFGPAIPATIFGPLWGRLADRFGYRAMLMRAMISAAVILSFMGLAPSPAILFGLRLIQGSLTGTIFAAQALVAKAVPEKETGRSMGLLQMSVFGGATLGPLLGGTVASLVGYRATYLVAGILLATATVIVVAFVREPQGRAKANEAKPETQPSMWSVLAIPSFAAAVGLTLIVQLAGTAQFPVVPLFVQDLLHSSNNVPAATGWLLAAAGLAGGAGSYVVGRLQHHVRFWPLLATCLVLSSALLVPQAIAGSYLALIVTRCIAAVAFGGLLSLVGTLAAVSSPSDAKGTAFGIIGAASSLGFGVGPLLGGSIVGVVGVRAVFLLSAGLLGLAPLGLGAALYRGRVTSGMQERAPRLASEQGQ